MWRGSSWWGGGPTRSVEPLWRAEPDSLSPLPTELRRLKPTPPMSYRFQDRLDHTSKRMSQNNYEDATYVAGTTQIPIHVSPILISADELNPGGGTPSLVRVERQDFAVWVCQRGPSGECGLGTLYPPAPGHKIVRRDGSEFTLSSMGSDEPPYTHVTSNRNRCILHTVRTKA